MFSYILQQFFNALQLGSVYALIALGYCLVYGVLLLINFAHGDIFMVGAYIAYFAATFFLGQHTFIPSGPNDSLAQQVVFAAFFALILTAATSLLLKRRGKNARSRETLAAQPASRPKGGLSGRAVAFGAIFLALTAAIWFVGPKISVAKGMNKIFIFIITIPLTMLLTSVVGIFIERVAYKPLRLKGANRLYVVITALMAGLMLEYGNLSLLGTQRLSFPTLLPPVNFDIGNVHLSLTKLLAILACFLVFALLQWIVTKTKLGMAMRAVSYDKFAVPLMGIPLDVVIIFTFFLGSSMAGLAGLLYATNFSVLDALMGSLIGWKAFVAAVVGGIGEIRGALVGGLLLGFLEVAVAAAFSSRLRDLLTFTILLCILTWKPTGLFGKPRTTKI